MNKCMIYAMISIKGGVSKTVSAVNLGVGLARKGYKVLLVDADEQGSWNRYLSGKIGMEEACEGYRTGVAFYSTVTKIVDHPEEGHYELVVINEGYWE